MKKLEFWENRPNGPVMIEKIDTGDIEVLDESKKEFIESFLNKIRDDYPQAYQALCKEYAMSANKRLFMVIRFIKCNFSENDKQADIDEEGNLNPEDVHCPLKCSGMLCKYQGIICNPKQNSQLTDRELEYIPFLISGADTNSIADKMCVSHFTVENTRKKIYRKLGFDGKNAIAQLTTWAIKNKINPFNQ